MSGLELRGRSGGEQLAPRQEQQQQEESAADGAAEDEGSAGAEEPGSAAAAAAEGGDAAAEQSERKDEAARQEEQREPQRRRRGASLVPKEQARLRPAQQQREQALEGRLGRQRGGRGAPASELARQHQLTQELVASVAETNTVLVTWANFHYRWVAVVAMGGSAGGRLRVESAAAGRGPAGESAGSTRGASLCTTPLRSVLCTSQLHATLGTSSLLDEQCSGGRSAGGGWGSQPW